jgi:hypothetical protein
MQTAENLSLGHFGDRRLDKGGRRFSGGCFARVVFVCAELQPVYGVSRCVFGVL